MRFRHRPPEPVPKMGETRTVRRFLWKPLRLDNETRWLEWAEVREDAVAFQRYYYEICFEAVKWAPQKFID